MRLRRCSTETGFEVQALSGSDWVSLNQAPVHQIFASDLDPPGLALDPVLDTLRLSSEARQAIENLLPQLAAEATKKAAPLLPVQPRSFRDFMLFEKHVIESSRGYVKRFMPGLYPLTQLVERVTGRPFKRFRPHKLWYQQPIYYLSNHLNFSPSNHALKWPSYTKALDYELELGAILAKPLFNATPEEAADAIGGFVVLNDVSARDIQKDEMESGFGPQKAKHFISTMSDILVTADEILPHIDRLGASVSINGDCVAECSTANMHFSLPEAIAFASKDEQLHPGELFGSGTLPGGTGMENGHWLAPGDTVTLQIDRVGAVTNLIQGGP